MYSFIKIISFLLVSMFGTYCVLQVMKSRLNVVFFKDLNGCLDFENPELFEEQTKNRKEYTLILIDLSKIEKLFIILGGVLAIVCLFGR